VGGTGNWTHVDKTRIATSGFSCGGIDAILAGKDDPRVSNIWIFSSGCLTAASRQAWLGNLTKPAFYFMGGPSDVAYSNVSSCHPLPITTSDQ
jgi:dienelactone hydrolase